MIEIYVASYNGRSPPAELKGRFGPAGGTLGRGADNQLVLPDPARHVSRVQARVRYDGARFLIANVSDANPLFLNDAEIESGSEKPLVAGDELRIGLYALGVRAPAPAGTVGAPAFAGAGGPVAGGPLDPLAGLGGGSAGPNPFADLLGPAVAPPLPLGGAGSSPPPRPMAELPRMAPAPSSGMASTPPVSGADPFADLLRPSAPAASPAGPQEARASASSTPRFSDRIPDNFNPFALPSSAPRNTDDPLRDLAGLAIDLKAVDANAKRNSLLEFQLAPKSDPQDPLHGGTPSLVDSQQVVDPLRLFGTADDGLLHGSEVDPLAHGRPMRDSIPEIGAHFTPPRSLPETPVQPPLAKAPSAPVAGHSAVGATPPAPATRAATTVVPASPVPAQAAIAPPDIDALLTAFLKGARMTDLSAPVRLTPALMEMMGTLVYQATAGAMELIAARQITKREIRAEVTMIVARGNNPLKFLPTPEAAILQMLGPKMPGFMTTGEAMQDAFDDLRAHEVGVIAGMRAALAEVLRRFDPVLLQERLGKGGLLDTLVPTARRARLWDLFEARFQELYREANDDFQSLFGEAFTKAYEEQIELDRARRRRS